MVLVLGGIPTGCEADCAKSWDQPSCTILSSEVRVSSDHGQWALNSPSEPSVTASPDVFSPASISISDSLQLDPTTFDEGISRCVADGYPPDYCGRVIYKFSWTGLKSNGDSIRFELDSVPNPNVGGGIDLGAIDALASNTGTPGSMTQFVLRSGHIDLQKATSTYGFEYDLTFVPAPEFADVIDASGLQARTIEIIGSLSCMPEILHHCSDK